MLIILTLLCGFLLPTPQQPTSTWTVAKPVVDRWLQEYQDAGRTVAARNKIVADIKRFLDDTSGEIWAYEAAAIGYNQLNLNADAVGVMRAYRTKFPDDRTLASRVFFFYGNWGSAADIESLPESWRQAAVYWENAVRVYARTPAATQALERAGHELVARVPVARDSGGQTRFRVAEAWLTAGVDPRAAERVAREAVAIAEVSNRPNVIADTVEQRTILNRLLIVNVNRSTLGWALYHQGRYADALAELQRAGELAEREALTTRAIFFRLGQTLEKLTRPDEALEAYFKELAWGDHRAPTQTAVNALYRARHGSLEGLDPLQRERVNALVAKVAETARDLIRSTNEPLGRFDLLDEQGQGLDLEKYRGKVVIIDFWATWCGICRPAMEHSNELRALSPDIVVIAPTLDPEATRPQAAAYLKQKNYPFLLVFDDEKRRAIKLPFIPARLLVDRTGRLRMVEFGYTPASAALFGDAVKDVLK